MTTLYDAVVAGHLCLDIIPDMSGCSKEEFSQLFLPGRLVEVGAVTFATGGAVSNTGLALHKLGLKTQLMGKVGNDLYGQAVKQIVAAYEPHLANGMVVDDTVNTSYTVVINPPGVDRVFLHDPAANDTFKASDINYNLVAQARVFHFGYPTIMGLMFKDNGVELTNVFRRAKETGVTTSLDMSLPDSSSPSGQADWATILKATLPFVDVFLPSIEEILYMLHRSTYNQLRKTATGVNILPHITPQHLSDISQELLALGAKIVVIKLGNRGLYLKTADNAALKNLGAACPANWELWANKELWVPVFKVDEVGTTGAGDSTIAGFISGLLLNMSPEETITAATAVGACNVEAADSLSGILSWEETLQRIHAGWPRRKLRLNAPGWHFDTAQHLWTR